ncbi:MAG: DUF2007 domain-containing protein [Bacteroidales bacterium]|nr:DUF2007 domain-containing protein [Bacteroidales bacterium]MCF8349673.1 DUF2007 domain-containing protein [Bacteroidales bacterium]MCF8374919.1 DUF2007 domain-containing protein [Bacteroidales bacterium]MCF8400102.1 DUF2007 domain-containing protein [Bacteroidales bacterium]
MDWITIRTFTFPQEAYFVKSLLESQEIPVFLKDELMVQVYNFASNAVGGVKLQVPEKDVEKAREILNENGYLAEEASQEPPRFVKKLMNFTAQLPLLGRLNFIARILILLFLLLFLIIFPLAL